MTSLKVGPNLFIVGAPKCGTTAWVHYLSSHPEIFFPAVKEPHYFSTDLRTRAITKQEYECLFEGAKSRRVRGVAPTNYLYSTVAAQGIANFDPNARIIVFLRDQEDFIPSLHNLNLYMGRESIDDLAEAWWLSGKRTPDTIPETCREPKFLDYEAMGRFDEQLERYFDAFPSNQIRVFHLRDWGNDPRTTYLEILRFLDLADDGRRDFPKVNEAKYSRHPRVNRLLHHPPFWVREPFRWLKATMGVHTLGLGNMLAGADAQKGYKVSAQPQIKDEIRRYYALSNKRAERFIWSFS